MIKRISITITADGKIIPDNPADLPLPDSVLRAARAFIQKNPGEATHLVVTMEVDE